MKDDVQFLKELQHELNTQDHDCQAEPRFWVLVDYRTVPANSEYDDCTIEYFHNDGDFTKFNDVKELTKFVEDYCLGEDEDLKRDFYNLLNCFTSPTVEDIWWFVEDELNECGFFSSVYVKEEEFIVPNTMFLTKQEAKRHIELNHYHYTSKVHTYAMTAWRAPKIERLLKILESFDWESISNTQ